jgi:hypothetical protein
MSEKPISPLRRRMLDDMTMRRFTRDTQRDYIRAVRKLEPFLVVRPTPLPVIRRGMMRSWQNHPAASPRHSELSPSPAATLSGTPTDSIGLSPLPLRCRPAAIDGDDLAGDERSPSGGGEYNGVGDLFRPASPFERHACDQPRLPFEAPGESIEHRGLDWAGRYGIDTDTECHTFQRRRFGQPFDSVLAGRIKRAPGAPRWPMVDDKLTMLPLPCACITRNSCFMLNSTPSTLVSKVAA